jgi:hypothetical protein
MSFLYPVFLAGAVAAAIPIVLHLLRRDIARDVRFSAVRLLPHSPVPTSEKRRLRDLLLLAARVFALLLLAAAFARPYLAGSLASTSPVVIVALDRSFSMDAPGRFADALNRARATVDHVKAGERVAVVAFDDRADVLAEPGTIAAARAALGRVQPTYGATRYAALLDKASELVEQSGGRLIVITDLQQSGWDDRRRPGRAPGLHIEVVDVGPPSANLAVTGLRTEADRVVATIRNTGPQLRTGQLRLEVDGKLAATAEYKAGAQSSTGVSIPIRTGAGAALAVSVDDPQGPAADNRRFVIAGSEHDDVLIISSNRGRSGFYVSRALAAASGGTADERVRAARDAAALASGDLSGYTAVVLLSTRGLERPARDAVAAFVRSGGGILIAASPDIEPGVLATMFDLKVPLASLDENSHAGLLSVTDLRHPIFQPFGALSANLGQVRFERAWRLRPDGWDVAARFTDGTPALLERAEGRGRLVLFASDFDRRWNDFPVQPSFVPFAVEAVRYVSGVRAASGYLVNATPEGVPAKPGIFRIALGNRLVAVNVDPRESEPSRLAPEALVTAEDHPSDVSTNTSAVRVRQIEARQSYWQYGLLLMIGALVAESIVGRA